MSRLITAFAVAAVSLAAVLPARPADGSQVVSARITDLTRARIAFTGTCVAAEPMIKDIGEGGRLFVTKYTFSVEDVIKGEVPATFSFTHMGGSRSAAQALGMIYVPGMPLFEQGARYTVFLSSESELGLRGVINLGCGKFNFVESADGKTQVVNDYGNKALFTGLPPTPRLGKALSAGGVAAGEETGPIDYDRFVEMIRELEGRGE